MRFEDATWKVVPVTTVLKGRPVFRIERREDGMALVYVSKTLREQVGLKTGAVEILVNHRAVAIRHAAPKAQHPRKLSQAGYVSCRELVDLLGLEKGEKFELEVSVDAGHVIGELPAAVTTRVAKKGGV